ncbi:MAG: alkaline phosphatase family protein [Ferruginibacter sp.]|nr:alkaline phosphatase family protein [Ferruginibacter sp.]
MRIKYLFSIIILTSFSQQIQAQKVATQVNEMSRPKIVVGIVIDQMRWDYLYRFYNRYSNGGFKKLITKGYSFENTMIPYVPTYTAVGHTTIFTGGIPATHGMVGNNWYEKTIKKNMYCTEDSTVQGVGNNDNAGKMSPRNLWATTVTDELRLSTNFESKVIGIALKDRGAILPAGHSANAAYWYDEKTGKWITSNYYMQQLPQWVNTFNAKDEAGTMMKNDWNTLYPITTYTQSTADNKDYEQPLSGLTTPTFPHKLSTVNSVKYSTFKYTPYAATFTFNFAKAAIENEKLGSGKATDFLTISISSTDYMGHSFGPNSIEAEDTYLRLDKDIANFLNDLDLKFGKNNYLVFLSADHGAAHIPGFLKENKIDAGVFDDLVIKQQLNKLIEDSFNIKNSILAVQNYQVYIDKKMFSNNDKDVEAAERLIIQSLKLYPFITSVFETGKISNATLTSSLKEMFVNGYTETRSGDIQFILKPCYFDGGLKGTTHGLWNPYDAHIPLLFYGWNIKPGKTNRETYMTDIAPTLAAMLHIQMPSGSVGKVLMEVVR